MEHTLSTISLLRTRIASSQSPVVEDKSGTDGKSTPHPQGDKVAEGDQSARVGIESDNFSRRDGSDNTDEPEARGGKSMSSTRLDRDCRCGDKSELDDQLHKLQVEEDQGDQIVPEEEMEPLNSSNKTTLHAVGSHADSEARDLSQENLHDKSEHTKAVGEEQEASNHGTMDKFVGEGRDIGSSIGKPDEMPTKQQGLGEDVDGHILAKS